MAAAGAKRIFGSRLSNIFNPPPYTQDQIDQLGKSAYFGLTPGVAAARKADASTNATKNILDYGTSFAPVTNVGEGIARVLAGFAGGQFNRADDRKWGAIDRDVLAKQQAALWAAQHPDIVGDTSKALQVSPAISTPIAGADTSPVASVASALTPARGAQPATAATRPFPLTGQSSSQLTTKVAPRELQPGQSARARDIPVAQGGGTGFNDYRSTSYDPLETAMEQKYGLPPGILKSIRINGERSNSDQVSSTGAKSVYQFVPGTRRRFLKTYGVDAWSGPQGAVEAAALHLRDSLKRNGGDVVGAVKDYRGYNATHDDDYIKRVVTPLGINYDKGSATGGTGGHIQARDLVPQYSVPEGAPAPDMKNIMQTVQQADLPLPDRVRSLRMAVANNLLGDANIDPAIRAMAMEPYLQKGMDEEQASKESEYQARLADRTATIGAARNLYGQQDSDVRSRQNADHSTFQAANIAQDVAAQAQENAMEQIRQRGEDALGRARVANEAKLDGARARASVMSQKDATGYVGNASLMSKIDNAIAVVQNNRQFFGLQNMTPTELYQRFGQAGVDAQAAVATLASEQFHKHAGTAQSVGEVERLKPWVAQVTNTPENIITKLQRMKQEIQIEQDTYDRFYPNDPRVQITAAGAMGGQPGTLPTALPPGVTVKVRPAK